MSLLKTTTQPLKVGLIEAMLPDRFRISSRETEEYRKTFNVDGQLDSVGLLLPPMFGGKLTRDLRYVLPPMLYLFPLLHGQKSLTKLEVLDTAGAEQFTSLNEVYIKVVHGLHLLVGNADFH